MRRAVTAVLLGGWVGFLGVAAAIPALVVLHVAHPALPVPSVLAGRVADLTNSVVAHGNGELLAAAGASVGSATVAALLLLALWLCLQPRPTERIFGERLALGGLAAAGLLVATVRWAGSAAVDCAGALPAFVAALGLSAAAILLDRLLDGGDAESDDDDEAFRAALALIGQGMARDAARHAERARSDHSRGNR